MFNVITQILLFLFNIVNNPKFIYYCCCFFLSGFETADWYETPADTARLTADKQSAADRGEEVPPYVWGKPSFFPSWEREHKV
jgi:hypothetical protein